MAFDFGLERIGVAIGNTMLKIPHPLTTITGNNKYVKLEQIAVLIEKWNPQLLVVGMPSMNADVNSIGIQKKQLIDSINNFARMLRNKFSLDTQLVNEEYSSSLAESQLYEQGISSRSHKGKLDQLAACNILERYFNISTISEKNDI